MSGVPAKKSLGQNFLADRRYLAPILAAAELSASDAVLEIGPGRAVLTEALAEQVACLVAVEIDGRLIEPLQQRFAGQPHVHIVHGDILEQAPDQWIAVACLRSPISYKVVANLPYYITSAVLRHLLESHVPPTLAVVMVQWEVAQRICAVPGDMSLLAASVQFYAEPTIVQRVPAAAFSPRPKVDSAILQLRVRLQPAVEVDPLLFFRVVRAGFSQKRKQIHNSLAAGLLLDKTTVNRWLADAGIQPARRAETFSMAEWGALCRTCPSPISS